MKYWKKIYTYHIQYRQWEQPWIGNPGSEFHKSIRLNPVNVSEKNVSVWCPWKKMIFTQLSSHFRKYILSIILLYCAYESWNKKYFIFLQRTCLFKQKHALIPQEIYFCCQYYLLHQNNPLLKYSQTLSPPRLRLFLVCSDRNAPRRLKADAHVPFA